MRKVLLVAATFCLAMSGAAMADYKLDAKGKCHDEHGKFAKQELCKTMAPVHMYKLDAKKKCRDEKGHFAADKFCKA